ncbi:DUF2975 domain-containing protein [Cellulomonas hominis]|uniref:DUF2975 domain-containing protein n=1 Tax=Cellulomonas hominis TaxID=156981 RepID=UPI001BA27ED2|nr:DUF2975 domain-containing protein [Cellulomonas hominis]VTR76151.1 hypothetical protein CHMI_00907 [Cellulomonas hominis]
MNLTRPAVALLRVLLVLLFLACVIGQTLSWPGQFASLADADPPVSHLRWPLTAVAVLILVCVEIVIVCTWKLLTMVKADRIFSPDAFAWVDGIVWAIVGAWLIFLAGALTVGITIYVTPELRDPGIPVMLGGILLGSGVLVLLMIVMRALLRQAAALRTDMDAVI